MARREVTGVDTMRAQAAPRLGGGLALADLAYGRAFVALATGDAELDPYLPPLAALEAEAHARRAAIAALDREELWDAVAAVADRAGAPPEAHASIARLRGGAPVACTGQQPGLLGGPVFTLYKAATAVVLARTLERVLGEAVVPVFWAATDDSDFDEIARATIAGADLNLTTVGLGATLADPERMLGALPADAGREAVAEARTALAGTTHGERALALAESVWERGLDWGEGFTACLYALFGADGLVVVDARAPALRQLARPLLARYLDDVGGFAATVERAGEAMAAAGLGRQLGAFAAQHPLYREEPPRRLRLVAAGKGEVFAAEARRVLAAGGQLWPGIALRPLVVDTVLPVVARVLGPAEVAYMAQLAPAYGRLGVRVPPVVPRLTATLVPRAAERVAAATVGGIAALVRDPSSTLAAYYRRELPLPARRALEELEGGQRTGFARAREALGALGRGLDQLVDSVAAKADFQLGRLWEAAIKREKSRREAAEPVLRHLAPFLRPDQGLQERRLAALGALAIAGPPLLGAISASAEANLAGLSGGRGEHFLIGVEP